MSSIYKIPDSEKLICIDKIIPSVGEIFYTVRLYEKQTAYNQHGNRIVFEKQLFGDCSMRADRTDKQQKNDHSEIYRLIELHFPELSAGSKQDGFLVIKSLPDIVFYAFKHSPA
jgi:hypothetical protein